jgi:hypothetical protein
MFALEIRVTLAARMLQIHGQYLFAPVAVTIFWMATVCGISGVNSSVSDVLIRQRR